MLLGGGHAHVRVLQDLCSRRLAGWDVHLISPYPRQIYSGMLPGWMAGHYEIEQCAVRLDALALAAGIAFHRTAGVAVDLARRSVACADGTEVGFDVLSIDTGPMTALEPIRGGSEHVVPIRPIEKFIDAWPALVERITATCRRFDLVVIGAGAAGVELAFAIQHRALLDGWSHLKVSLIGPGALPMDGASRSTQLHVSRLLRRRGIRWFGNRRVTGASQRQLTFDNGEPLAFDTCVAVTGAASPTWARESGLATDQAGFIAVGPTLQSTSHPNVFAAGDVAAYHVPRPKSGVFAVRAGLVLATNLRAYCQGGALLNWQPQRRALYLVSTGGRHALASWGRWSWSGSWAWRWKDWMDRRFMRNLAVNT